MAEDGRRVLNFQGILQFCTENTKVEDTTGPSTFSPMKDEDKKWLEEALTGVQGTDPIKRVIELIGIVGQNLYEATDESEAAMEELISWCEQIDIASDFVKVGGHDLVFNMLASPDSSIRWHGADLLATACQHNPFCQSVFLASNILRVLTVLIDRTTEDDLVRIKAQYAMSCIVRANSDGQRQLVECDGLSLLMRAMQSHVDKLRTKAAFLMLELVPENRDQLCDMGMVEQLVGMLRSEHSTFHEHLMSALLLLVDGHERAQADARRPQVGLAALLQERIGNLEGKEEFEEELGYARRLYSTLFGESAVHEESER